MGVRFACHACGKQLNIKQDLAGRRGVCPSCSARFRIPLQDTAQSAPIENASAVAAPQSANSTTSNVVSTPEVHSANSAVAPAATISSLELLVGDSDATWYVRPPTGGQYGPANGDVLRQWITEGRVAATALLWRDGWPQWREASEALPELTLKGTSPKEITSPKSTSPEVAITKSAEPKAKKQSLPASSRASTKQVPTKSDSENFGYEDSDFAGNTTYTAVKNESPRFTGSDDVGAKRRNRSNRKTLSIVFMTIITLLLIAAIGYLITR